MLQVLGQNFLNALQLGSVYALIALGYTMVYGILTMINFAHGDIFMVSSYLCLAAALFLLGLPLQLPLVLVFTGSFTSYATPQLLGGERQMMMGTFLYQRAMVTFDWVGASTIAAIMVVVTLTTVLVMSKMARRLNPVAG